MDFLPAESSTNQCLLLTKRCSLINADMFENNIPLMFHFVSDVQTSSRLLLLLYPQVIVVHRELID